MEGIPDISPFKRRYESLDVAMSRPDFFADQRKAAELSREHQKLARLIELYEKLKKLEEDIEEHEAIIEDSSADEEFRELAKEELPEMEAEREKTREQVLFAMIPPDPSDSRNTVMEIRAGAGGDEASLFASELHRMYCRYAEHQGWRTETMSVSESEAGGVKEIVFLISGEDVYKRLKYESGVHRVQRIPATESNGRIHTSTVTVAVLPEAEEVDIHIDPNDLEITVTRASGAGGQHVNTTDSAVQMTHKPTGVMVYCADERSQLKNKVKALKVMRARLLQMKQEEERSKYAANRRSQIGTGDRSERIRTYNFPQSRCTDHRIGLTLHSLDEIMEGDITDLVSSLERADLEDRLAELMEQR